MVQEPEKPTKSAIKKANRLARLERKQRQKLKQGSEQQPPPPVTPTTLPQPVTPVIPEEGSSRSGPLLVPWSLPSKAQPLTQASIRPAMLEVKENYLEKYSPRNGSAAIISVASDNQVSRPDPETAKKRQNVLTRTLWTFIMIGGFIGNYPD